MSSKAGAKLSQRFKDEILEAHQLLGKQVWLQFSGKFYEGTITRFAVKHRDENVKKSLDLEHYVKFGDEDDDFYDLKGLERDGNLLWREPTEKKAKKEKKQSNKKRAASVASLKRNDEDTTTDDDDDDEEEDDDEGAESDGQGIATARIVTPLKKARRSHGGSRSKPKPAPFAATAAASELVESDNRKLPPTPPVSSYQPSNFNTTSPAINLEEFEHWFRFIYKTKKKKTGDLVPPTEDNVKQVLNKVRPLVHGEGLRINGGGNRWPEGKYFLRGQKVDLNSDFDALKKDFLNCEEEWGVDTGNGWAGRHQLSKLALYRDYVLEQRCENNIN